MMSLDGDGISHLKEIFLSKLRNCPRYPFNEYEDGSFFHYVYEEYPGVNLIAELDKKIAWWKKHPSALGEGCKFYRAQLDAWFQNEYRFKKSGRVER